MRLRPRRVFLVIALAGTVPACRDAPVVPSTVGLPSAGEYTLRVSEARSDSSIFVCLTISPPGAAVSPITPATPDAISLRVLMETTDNEAIARLPSGSGANGGDLRLTFMPAARGIVSGIVAGQATAADGRSGFQIGHGTLTGTATDDWRHASGRIQGGNMSFTVGGTSCSSSSSEATWQLSRP